MYAPVLYCVAIIILLWMSTTTIFFYSIALPTKSTPEDCISVSTPSSFTTLAFFFFGVVDEAANAPPVRSLFFRSVTIMDSLCAFFEFKMP
jgi:hypothetical protein